MTSMDYFRRPVLAGKALKHLNAGFLRGSRRRLDPDGFSAVPYFSGVSTGQTLNLDLDGTPYPVALTGATPNYQSILNDINTALGVNGEATDEDGSIGIKTFTPSGYLGVTGGTAAAALGFDVTKQPFRSAAGDLYGSPERRVGNPYGAAFPIRGENLTVDTFNRALGRISSNLDVLFSEHMRQDGRMAKIPAGSTTVSSPAVGTSLISLPAATRVFTGKNILPATPTAEALAPFVQLIDPVTGLPPATCRVIDIVRGAVAGSPPYVDAPNYAGAGSVVNVDLVKYSGTITGIANGRVVEVAGATFLSNGTQVGDWANITGAANVVPWSNNGYRWVVEEIIDNTHVALRPMSKSESAQAGLAGNTEEQPIVDLNGEATGVFGTLEIHTGTYTDGVKLVVQPPIPAGATYDVWVQQPLSVREANSGSVHEFVPVSGAISQRDPLPNGIISGFNISGNSTLRTVGEGFVRMHGKILRIPAHSYTPAGLGAGTHYVYFDENDARIKTSMTELPADPRISYDPHTGATDPVIRPIARFVSTGASFGGISEVDDERLCRCAVPSVERITVGEGGEFRNITGLAKYLNALAAAFDETSNEPSAYPHFEIIVLSDLSTGNDVDIYYPFLTFRGATPETRISVNTSPFLTFHNCYYLKFQDLVLDCSGGEIWLRDAHDVVGDGAAVYFQNVKTRDGDPWAGLISSIDGARLKKLVLTDCSINVTNSISSAAPAGTTQDILIERSKILYSGDGSGTMMFNQAGGPGNDWTGSSIRLYDNVFSGWYTSDLAGTLISNDAGPANAVFDAEGNIFTFGTFPLNSKASLWKVDTPTISFRHNVFTNSIPRAIDVEDTSTASDVSYNNLIVAPHDVTAGTEAIRARHVAFNSILSIAPSSGLRGMVGAVYGAAVGNYIHGHAIVGLTTARSGGVVDDVVFQGNKISIDTGVQTGIKCHAIWSSGKHSRIVGNTLDVKTSGGYALNAGTVCVDDANTSVEGNYLISNGCFGIVADTANANGIISNNEIHNTLDSGVAGSASIKLRNRWLIIGNRVFGAGLVGYTILRTATGSSSRLILSTNNFVAPTAFDFSSGVVSLLLENCSIEGDADLSTVGYGDVLGSQFFGTFICPGAARVVGNGFTSVTITNPDQVTFDGNTAYAAVACSVTNGRLLFTNNSITGATVSFTKTAAGTGYVLVKGNYFADTAFTTSTGVDTAISAIDTFSGNLANLTAASTITLRHAVVDGNEFRGISGPSLIVEDGVFSNNQMKDVQFALYRSLVTGNRCDPANSVPYLLEAVQSSNNYYTTTDSYDINGLFHSTNDYFDNGFGCNDAILAITNIRVIGNCDVSTASTTVPSYIRSSYIEAGNLQLGDADIEVSDCTVDGNIASVLLVNSQRIHIRDCIATNINISPAVTGTKAGSKLYISGSTFTGATIVGANYLYIDNVVTTGTVSASYFGIWEARDSTFNIISSGGGSVMRVYDCSISYPNSMLGTVELIMRGCTDMDEIVVPGGTGNCFISECAASQITVAPNSLRIVCLIDHNYTGEISAAGKTVTVKNNTVYGNIYVEFPDGSKSVSITGNTAKSVRSSTPNSYAIRVSGTTAADAVDSLDISDNTLELDNIGGSSSEVALGVLIGGSVTTNVVKQLKMNGNTIRASRVPDTVSYLADVSPWAIKVNSNIHSGIISGNEIVLPRPGAAYTGGGFVRWVFLEGFDALAAATVTILASNHFAKSSWTHAATPVWLSNSEVSNDYNDGSGVVSATGSNDIYNGGFHKFKNTAANVRVPAVGDPLT